ncbi:hypothetical protein BKA59DRAFT_462043 [Fusarium tricinctum]|uniref:FHA domain-containing protein n=1 Tax=Fusarium tricinctum TaxID=61284 RepID=A0A8K0WGK2_9HYPO|nr:hypothetical protein BKA59DRAFT_462043 [Fusarium tricinctum]
MAVPEYRDEVLISLSSVNPPPKFSFPERRIFLSKKRTSIEIGRTSKRNASFEAARSNAWFDSPVMSRKHALITFDSEKQKVFLKDTGSLHGTYKNDVRLETNVNSEILNGDKVKFGAIIERGLHKYPPCLINTSIKFGSRDPEQRGNCFFVPEESDIEDENSGDDQVRNSCEMLHSNDVRTLHYRAMIDLTQDKRFPGSNLRNGSAFAPHSRQEVSQHPNMTLPQLSGPSPVSVEYVPTSPKDDTWQFSDMEDDEESDKEVDDVSQPISIADDARGPFDQLSDVQSESFASSPLLEAYDETDVSEDDDEIAELESEHDQDSLAIDNSFYSSIEPPPEEAPVATSMMVDNTLNRFATVRAVPNDQPEKPEAESPSICATRASQQADGTETASLNEIQKNNTDYTWKPDLPPVVPNNMFSSLKLPSISEAIAFNQCLPGQTMAELMGMKTGKHDFFNAREENRASALANNMRSQGQAQSVIKVPGQTSWVNDTSEIVSMGAENTKDNRDHQDQQLVASDLATSGTKFLDTPIEHPLESPSMVPALDDSSAFKFQESKRALGLDGSANKATHEAVVVQDNATADAVDSVESSRDAAHEPTSTKDNENKELETPGDSSLPHQITRKSKRKADEISVVTRVERRTSTRDGVLYRRPAFRVGKAQAVRNLRRAASAAVAPPAQKRLRRMAEVVGYAALGGVAVMSALIATAPTL